MTERIRAGRAAMLGALCAVTLVACNDGTQQPGSGEAIARVDATELRADQLDAELAQRMGARPGTRDAKALRQQAADALVERTLLVNQAVATGIDEDPPVVQAVARARDEVLAAAYLARTLELGTGPGEAEVRAYYDAHPELYAKRTLFHVRQISSRAGIEMAEVKAAAESLAGPRELVEWLRERGAPAKLRITALASEHVAPALRERLAALTPGQAVLVHNGDQLLVNYLIQARPAPVSFEAARPAITRSLAQSTRRERIREEIDRLRAQAKIVWLGDFAGRDHSARQDRAAGADAAGNADRVMTTIDAPAPATSTPGAPSPEDAAVPPVPPPAGR